jgi:TonB family protein
MRKKEKLLLILLTITLNCIGQNYHPLTLIAKGFTIMNSSNSKEIKSNKTIILTYNSAYSSLYIEGEGSHSFPNERYSEEPTSDGFIESYLSAETNTSMFGFWHILVFKMKDRTDFEISYRNGITYYAKNAKLYSEDGQIIHNPYVKDFKEFEKMRSKNNIIKVDSSTQSQTATEIKVEGPIYKVVEQLPVFQGGETALSQFIEKNIKYPPIAKEIGIQGKVIIRFVITKTGETTNVEIVRSLDPSCDKEAVRLAKSFPDWIPGKLKGENVAVYYTLTIPFKLE